LLYSDITTLHSSHNIEKICRRPIMLLFKGLKIKHTQTRKYIALRERLFSKFVKLSFFNLHLPTANLDYGL
jgi:hypothetical protein